MIIKYCEKCVFPETKPDLYFNENGICSACLAAENKDVDINWDERRVEFEKIIKEI